MVYINFFHGRDNPEQELDGWGFDGPILGPVQIQWTYGHIRFFGGIMGELEISGDLIHIDGKYYGDFGVVTDTDWAFLETARAEGRPILNLEQFIELNKQKQ